MSGWEPEEGVSPCLPTLELGAAGNEPPASIATVRWFSHSSATDSPEGLVKSKQHCLQCFFFFPPPRKSGRGPEQSHCKKPSGDAGAILFRSHTLRTTAVGFIFLSSLNCDNHRDICRLYLSQSLIPDQMKCGSRHRCMFKALWLIMLYEL